ncbi:MAG: hypothetical protein R3B72_52515 [Polyangiaceae bacterium]
MPSLKFEVRIDGDTIQLSEGDVLGRLERGGLPAGRSLLSIVGAGRCLVAPTILGYLVQMVEHGSVDEWVLVDEALPDDRVEVEAGCAHDIYPRSWLVGNDLARRAVLQFLKTGGRSPDLCWCQPLDVLTDEDW